MSTPTARTLELLRRSGYLAGVVECWIPRLNRHRDLFGCIDVLAVHPHREQGVLAIQATTCAHVADRLKKAQGRPELRTWLSAGNRFEVWGWTKRVGKWQVKRVEVRAGDLETVTLQAPPRRRRKERQPELFTA